MKISKRFREMMPLYKLFAGEERQCLDFSEEAAVAAYQYETHGKGSFDGDLGYSKATGMYNGYMVGKHWMDVTVAQWNRDINESGGGFGLLRPYELYADPLFREYWWWLDKVLQIPEAAKIDSKNVALDALKEQNAPIP